MQMANLEADIAQIYSGKFRRNRPWLFWSEKIRHGHIGEKGEQEIMKCMVSIMES